MNTVQLKPVAISYAQCLNNVMPSTMTSLHLLTADTIIQNTHMLVVLTCMK